MSCAFIRELVSADLDGELVADERVLLEAHLPGCASCRAFAERAMGLHRMTRIRLAPPVPDLGAAVLSRHRVPTRRRLNQLSWLRHPSSPWRLGLGAVAALQLVLAAPALIAHPDRSAELHVVHHLNAWMVAFAVGLLVVAWQPWRVRGVLPLMAALAGAMVFTVALDLYNGHPIGMPLTAHALELAGLVLAWGLARVERSAGEDPGGWASPGPRRRRRLARRGGAVPGLARARVAPSAVWARTDRPATTADAAPRRHAA
jgi:predicted anti-sigma-YlaC factor YlaD